MMLGEGFRFVLLSFLLGSVLLSTFADAHAYQTIPASRTVKHNGGPLGPGDKQSFNKGGPCGLNGLMTAGNTFGVTIPTAAETFVEGATIDIQTLTTAHHKGWYEFRLCRPADGGVNTNIPVTQECLNQHVLKFDHDFTVTQFQGTFQGQPEMEFGATSPADYAALPQGIKLQGHPGSCLNNGGDCSPESANTDRWVIPRNGVNGNIFNMKYKLPAGVTCERCIMQWHWQTGNSPFSFPEGFWGCTDIKIVASGPTEQPTKFPTPPPSNSPTREPTKFTATKSPTTSPTTLLLCVPRVEFVTVEFCQQPNACTNFPDNCKFATSDGTVPTTSPTPASEQGECHSLVSHIPDSWCQGVKCDPVYFEYCSTSGSSSTSSPTKFPTAFDTGSCTTEAHESSLTVDGNFEVKRLQLDVNVRRAIVDIDFEVNSNNQWKFSVSTTDRAVNQQTLPTFDLVSGSSGNAFTVEIVSLFDSSSEITADTSTCKPKVSLLVSVPPGTDWETSVTATQPASKLVQTGYANVDGTSGVYVFLPTGNDVSIPPTPSSDLEFSCGNCDGCLWVEFNACYTDWPENVCDEYFDQGYRSCTALSTDPGTENDPNKKPKNDSALIAVAAGVSGFVVFVAFSVLLFRNDKLGFSKALNRESVRSNGRPNKNIDVKLSDQNREVKHYDISL